MTHVRRSFIALMVFVAASAVMLIGVPQTQAAKPTTQPKANQQRNANQGQGQQQQQQPSNQDKAQQQENGNPNKETGQKPDKNSKEHSQGQQTEQQEPGNPNEETGQKTETPKETSSNEFGKQRSESARTQHGLSEEQQESVRLKQEELRIRLDAIQDLPLLERMQAMRELRADLKAWAFEQGLNFTPIPSKDVNIARYKSTNLKNINR